MPTTIGPITNVPQPGDPVDNDWAVDLTQFAVDDITIGPTQPTNPNAELWYDTGDSGVSYANMPRGLVGTAVAPNADQIFGTTGWQDVTGLSLTYTNPGGRIYRYSFMGTGNMGATQAAFFAGIVESGTVIAMQECITIVNTSTAFHVGMIHAPGTGPHTIKCQMYANGGAAKLLNTGGRAARFWIEDVGGS